VVVFFKKLIERNYLMGRKSKISNELKIKLVKKMLEENESIRNITKEYGISKSALTTWKKKYIELGEKSISTSEKNRHYSKEIREKAVLEYLNGQSSLFEVCKNYNISSVSVLNYWIRDYRKNRDLDGNIIRHKKHIRIDLEKKVSIVEYCIANYHNYNETIKKFGISYQQIYSWVKKYEKDGIKALVDNRRKSGKKDNKKNNK